MGGPSSKEHGKRPTAARLSRRGFLKGLAASAAAPYVASAAVVGAAGAVPPSQRLGIGVIGTGQRGSSHVGALRHREAVEVRAVCDPQEAKREAARKAVESFYAQRRGRSDFRGCLSTPDFREVLDRPDIDAVVIASPENWHALHAAWAVRAGKDVYCEKALSLTVAEGRAVVETVRKRPFR